MHLTATLYNKKHKGLTLRITPSVVLLSIGVARRSYNSLLFAHITNISINFRILYYKDQFIQLNFFNEKSTILSYLQMKIYLNPLFTICMFLLIFTFLRRFDSQKITYFCRVFFIFRSSPNLSFFKNSVLS